MTIKLEFDNWNEVLEFAGQIGGQIGGREVKVPAPMEATVTPAVVATPAPEPAPAPAAPAPVKKVTRQDVQTKAIALMDAGKQEQLQGLLQKYGAPALPSIPEDQLAAFMADLEAL